MCALFYLRNHQAKNVLHEINRKKWIIYEFTHKNILRPTPKKKKMNAQRAPTNVVVVCIAYSHTNRSAILILLLWQHKILYRSRFSFAVDHLQKQIVNKVFNKKLQQLLLLCSRSFSAICWMGFHSLSFCVGINKTIKWSDKKKWQRFASIYDFVRMYDRFAIIR